MRILHVVTNADLGGAPRVVTELSARAVRDGQASAVASVPEGPLWEHLDPRVERFFLRHLRREIRPGADLAASFELANLFSAWRPDIIHLHSSKAGVLGRLVAGRLRSRVVYTIHGFDTILKAHRLFLPLERHLARRCGAIVPVSGYDRRNLEEAGVRGDVVLIRNGVSDRRGATPLDDAAASRLRRAREAGAAVILSVARLAPPKRFDLFVEAARAVPPEGARFFWIGNTKSIDPATLPPNLELLGELPEAGNYIGLSDVFTLFSDYEGLPMSILEALSAGVPVLASAVGGIPEAVDGEVGGLVANESGAIVEALSALLADPGRRKEAGAAARRRYEERFSAERMWGAYLELYKRLLG